MRKRTGAAIGATLGVVLPIMYQVRRNSRAIITLQERTDDSRDELVSVRRDIGLLDPQLTNSLRHIHDKNAPGVKYVDSPYSQRWLAGE
jgi:hypothetical protein